MGYFEKADAEAAANSQKFAAEDRAKQERVQSGVKASVAAYAQKEERVKAGVDEKLGTNRTVADKYVETDSWMSPLTAGMQAMALKGEASQPLLSEDIPEALAIGQHEAIEMADFSILKQTEVAQAEAVRSIYPSIPCAAPAVLPPLEPPPAYRDAVARKEAALEQAEEKEEEAATELKNQEVKVGQPGGYVGAEYKSVYETADSAYGSSSSGGEYKSVYGDGGYQGSEYKSIYE